MFLRILKWLGIGVAGLFGLVVLAYGVLVVINWSDEPPSETYLAFKAELDEVGPVDHPDNGFVYFAGFDAPEGEDPVDLGREWIEWSQLPFDQVTKVEEPSGKAFSDLYDHAPIGELRSACGQFDSECLDFLHGDPDALRSAIAKSDWVVERYQELLGHSVWHELPPKTWLPMYGHRDWMFAGLLYRHQAWQLAREGAYQEALEMLDQEARLLRMMLEATTIDISARLVTHQLQGNLQWTNTVLRGADHSRRAAVPSTWLLPVSESERSRKRTYYMLIFLYLLAPLDSDNPGHEFWVERFSPLEQLWWRLKSPLVLPQAMLNLQAEVFQRTDNAITQDYPDIPEALEATEAYVESLITDRFLFGLRNPLWLVSEDHRFSYVGFLPSPEVPDLEGARRVLILAQQLRAEGVAPEEVPARLQTADIRNPYTDEPFGWDAEAGEITFNGLAGGDRGEFSLKY